MATAEQLKSLIKSHFDDDKERFTTLALQLAAHEARQGHAAVANDIRSFVERSAKSVRIFPANSEYDDYFDIWEPTRRLSEMIVNAPTRRRLERVIHEYRQQDRLKRHGLSNRRKLLIFGPPGTGKTMTAQVLATELKLPLLTVLMDRIVTKYMGETSSKLRTVFECIEERKGVYLFDEFDAIGGERGQSNDVGEIRRVLNSFLQFIERDESDSIIVAATNNVKLLDQALFRRFDDVVRYELPTSEEAKRLIANRLGSFKSDSLSIDEAIEDSPALSQAEIVRACDDAIKEAVLGPTGVVGTGELKLMLQERRSAYEAELA